MRATLILAALIAGCGHNAEDKTAEDKTAEHFCIDLRITFETPSAALGVARQTLEFRGQCHMMNAASRDLTVAINAFQSAALPFRDRPEVRRTLDALDKLPLQEVFALTCDDEKPATPEQIATLLPKIDQVRSKLADIVAACPAR